MNDGVSILVAVFLILIVLRWMLGGQQQTQQQRPRRPAARRVHRVTPQMVEMVRAMFPDIPTVAIQADLQRTGSVETTVDNALRDGGLPLPPTPSSQPGSPSLGNTNNNHTNNNSSSSSSRKPANYDSLIQRYKLDANNVNQQNLDEPPKVWETDAEKRQAMLKKRKEFMVLQARRKLMEQQRQEKPATANSTASTPQSSSPTSSSVEQAKSTTGSQNFDDLSVDELNTLTPEQRRLHMLQAFDKKA